MKTKEEVIKDAWGELMCDYTNIDLNSGWSNDCYSEGTFDWELFDCQERFVIPKIRPKCLKGIENNYGWIKVEDGLPKEDEWFFCILNGEQKMFMFIKDGFYNVFLIRQEVTHYQPIIKPKPPLY